MKNPETRLPNTPDNERSLFGEILDWMLAPLLFVWPISIAFTHYFAQSVAAYPYDQMLREQVMAVARQVKFVGNRPQVNFPSSARAMLRADETDSVYFQIRTHEGALLAGDTDLPPFEMTSGMPVVPGEVRFRQGVYKGEDLQIAYTFLATPGQPEDKWLLVEVGETLEKRS
ncbi:MAG TPA: sensor histidine kinase N-terminal domain-containing protein, partial [Rhodocyclaceae bacterium]|nr:sensor histidine kinase N-terminal domain-containing protein [Rhodocyclaceae bacterium]